MDRIVICEDESIVALDIKSFLTRNGFIVPAVHASAEDLLASVESNKPDLVLMDIRLQGEMDGIDAASILLSRWAIPVILLTANADSATMERAKLTQPYAYIRKPYDELELKTAIGIGLYRASMEKRLRSSEERYRGLFQDGVAPALLLDGSGVLLEANRALKRLAPGMVAIHEFLADSADLDALLDAMGKGVPYGPVEVRARIANGDEAWVLFSAAPIELPEGSAAYQCQAVDITERKQLLDQLVHAQKLSALGRFAGGVAHDFNNVLTAVLGYARLLRTDLEADNRPLVEVDGIEQAAKRAAALSRQLLMFSRREESAPRSLRLSSLIKDLEKMLRRVIGDGATLLIRTADGGDTVLADTPRLEQAVVNLVANARDAMPDGGRIVVSTGSVLHANAVEGVLGTIPPGDWAYIEVEDEGVGIPPEHYRKVFDPFFTTKSADRGTGLGLSTVMTIVQQAAGHIQLDSRLGTGTTVRMLLPRQPALQVDDALSKPENSHEHNASRPNAPGRAGTILLVENDDSVRAILEAMLDRAGYRVLSASHPGEALLLAERGSPPPDALVADRIMPLMNGSELATRLRASIADLPALLLCGAEGPVSGEASAENEAGDDLAHQIIITKPFGEDELLAALDTLMDTRKS
ncbi:MAG: response regulator [Spirochaetales bacterium]|nr:response regulator [Spirochaetales bacterium]